MGGARRGSSRPSTESGRGQVGTTATRGAPIARLSRARQNHLGRETSGDSAERDRLRGPRGTVIYLDTGCLLKLYYPEPESSKVAEISRGQPIAFLSLHELELWNALELKVFRKEARPAQVRAVQALVADDLRSGTLHRPVLPWDDVWQESKALAQRHTRKFGCRSLDILHCSAARRLSVASFVTTDARQRRLAAAVGLTCPAV